MKKKNQIMTSEEHLPDKRMMARDLSNSSERLMIHQISKLLVEVEVVVAVGVVQMEKNERNARKSRNNSHNNIFRATSSKFQAIQSTYSNNSSGSKTSSSLIRLMNKDLSISK